MREGWIFVCPFVIHLYAAVVLRPACTQNCCAQQHSLRLVGQHHRQPCEREALEQLRTGRVW